MNTVKRMLDVLHCRVEEILKSWAAYLTITSGNNVFGEQMNSITVMLKKKYKNYLKAIVDKLVSNVRMIFACFMRDPVLTKTVFIWTDVIISYGFFRHKLTGIQGSSESLKKQERPMVKVIYERGCRLSAFSSWIPSRICTRSSPAEYSLISAEVSGIGWAR